MIIGIGIDVVQIIRIERLIKKWGSKFTKRVFSQNEIKYSETHLKSEQHFAANFAVKESFVKALGTGFKSDLRIRDIEVLRDKVGKPYINLFGKAKQKIAELGINRIHTSISHEGEYS
ncbi:MAG: holo-ACP synthase, partial [Thermodesulfobacteriota bacterium]